ncbi:MAG: PIN domain-containing protein [Candidatus Omnitrophota bacterium]
MIAILNRCMTDWDLVGSEVLDYEIAGISDEERMRNVESLLQFVHEWVMIDKEVVARARTVHGMGIDTFDALHLACAERSVDIFLTTDDTLIKSVKKHANKITIRVKNPVQWFMEVTANGSEDAQ